MPNTSDCSKKDTKITDYFSISRRRTQRIFKKRVTRRTRDTTVTDYFPVTRGRRFYCLRCRLRFESAFHKAAHVCFARRSHEEPIAVRFQNLHEGILIRIVEYLDELDDVVSLIRALPSLTSLHGFVKHWRHVYHLTIRALDQWTCEYSVSPPPHLYTAYWEWRMRELPLATFRQTIHSNIRLSAARNSDVAPPVDRWCHHCAWCRPGCWLSQLDRVYEEDCEECEERTFYKEIDPECLRNARYKRTITAATTQRRDSDRTRACRERKRRRSRRDEEE